MAARRGLCAHLLFDGRTGLPWPPLAGPDGARAGIPELACVTTFVPLTKDIVASVELSHLGSQQAIPSLNMCKGDLVVKLFRRSH